MTTRQPLYGILTIGSHGFKGMYCGLRLNEFYHCFARSIASAQVLFPDQATLFPLSRGRGGIH